MSPDAYALEVTPDRPLTGAVKAGPLVRRRAAILVADVAGYSRLMDRDEAGTHARMRQLRATIIEPMTALHCGRIVRVAGDGLLVLFSTAFEAVHCAVALQRAIAASERCMPPGLRLRMRMGINVADILLDGAEIAGRGVNLAARLEALAAPGGICVSRAVRDQVCELRYIDGGWRRVKNIARPVRVFHLECVPPYTLAWVRATLADLFAPSRRTVAHRANASNPAG